MTTTEGTISTTSATRRVGRRRTLTGAVAVVALGLAVTGCGSDEGDADGRDERGDATPVTFESDPIPAPPLFGNAPSDAETEQAAEIADDTSEAADEATVAVEPCPTDIAPDDCVQHPDVVPPPAPHVVAEAWVPFCDLIVDLEARPFPSAESEQLLVIDSWLQELAGVAPTAISEQLGVLGAITSEALAADDPSLVADADQSAERAAAEIGEAIDGECFGR